MVSTLNGGALAVYSPNLSPSHYADVLCALPQKLMLLLKFNENFATHLQVGRLQLTIVIINTALLPVVLTNGPLTSLASLIF